MALRHSGFMRSPFIFTFRHVVVHVVLAMVETFFGSFADALVAFLTHICVNRAVAQFFGQWAVVIEFIDFFTQAACHFQWLHLF